MNSKSRSLSFSTENLYYQVYNSTKALNELREMLNLSDPTEGVKQIIDLVIEFHVFCLRSALENMFSEYPEELDYKKIELAPYSLLPRDRAL